MTAKKQGTKKGRGILPGIKKVSTWTGLFRNFFTIVSSIVSVVTLAILIRQNENTYRPDLEISAGESFFEVRHNGRPLTCEDLKLYDSNDSTLESLHFSLLNLGMGSAKDVTAGWQTGPENMPDTLTLGVTSLVTGMHYDRPLNAFIFGDCIYQPENRESRSFVLPVNQEKHASELTLPGSYFLFWSSSLIRVSGASPAPDSCAGLIRSFCGKYGRLALDLRYRDINKQQYQKSFSLLLVPRYIDLGANKIVFSTLIKEDSEDTADRQAFRITVLFADRSIRTFEAGI